MYQVNLMEPSFVNSGNIQISTCSNLHAVQILSTGSCLLLYSFVPFSTFQVPTCSSLATCLFGVFFEQFLSPTLGRSWKL